MTSGSTTEVVVTGAEVIGRSMASGPAVAVGIELGARVGVHAAWSW